MRNPISKLPLSFIPIANNALGGGGNPFTVVLVGFKRTAKLYACVQSVISPGRYPRPLLSFSMELSSLDGLLLEVNFGLERNNTAGV